MGPNYHTSRGRAIRGAPEHPFGVEVYARDSRPAALGATLGLSSTAWTPRLVGRLRETLARCLGRQVERWLA